MLRGCLPTARVLTSSVAPLVAWPRPLVASSVPRFCSPPSAAALVVAPVAVDASRAFKQNLFRYGFGNVPTKKARFWRVQVIQERKRKTRRFQKRVGASRMMKS